MTYTQLDCYRQNKAQLDEITEELNRLEVSDSVQTAAEPPYSLHNRVIHGVPTNEHTAELFRRKHELEADCKTVEGFVRLLDDRHRVIFELKFMRKRRYSNREIADIMGYKDEGTIRKIIKTYVQNVQKND